jgi:TIR domain
MARVDFFISYTKADQPMAEWIAWQLEAAGYTTLIQAWDSRPGMTFLAWINQAATQAERTLVVLSPAYEQAEGVHRGGVDRRHAQRPRRQQGAAGPGQGSRGHRDRAAGPHRLDRPGGPGRGPGPRGAARGG